MKPMETLQDLVEEVKVRTVWWVVVIFAVSYFLSHTSKSMLMNVPISILLVYALRILSREVEIHWRVPPVRRQTYLSHLAKKQLSVDDPRLSNLPASPKWKRKIDSPLVEAAIDNLIRKILQEFVVDLWYSAITPDREVPEQIRLLIVDVLAEISRRVKEINLVDLLTRELVDMIGDHIDLYRRNQSAIGVDVMVTLSSEERDERLKHHLMASKDLHPALVSSECEYKVLQRLMGGVLAVVLRPRDAQCPLVRSIARELLTCLVMQPIMSFASPGYINELIEYLFLTAKEKDTKEVGGDRSNAATTHHHDNSGAFGGVQSGEPTTLGKSAATFREESDLVLAKSNNQGMVPLALGTSGHSQSLNYDEGPARPQAADWARMLEVTTQRRTEVLAPENLENLWTKGRNYKKKAEKFAQAGNHQKPVMGTSQSSGNTSVKNSEEILPKGPVGSAGMDDKFVVRLTDGANVETPANDRIDSETRPPVDEGVSFGLEANTIPHFNGSKTLLKRSSSTSALQAQHDSEKTLTGGLIISEEFYSPNFGFHKEEHNAMSTSDILIWKEGRLHAPKLRCRVVGAYFEKIGSKSFAVYSIAVRDAEKRTWFVKRRYSNFERLHRYLKDIPNYNLHLPPKRFLSSSTDDSFVHQRCIQLDKYLQDLLSIANVAEQHEVWDFLSISSKNYSFGKSSSVMRTLAVNVDDAMDDIMRQFKGVSDGLIRKVSGPSLSSPIEASSFISGKNSWYAEDVNKNFSGTTSLSYDNMDTSNYLSDHEEGVKDGDTGHEEIDSGAKANEWHSDNELNSKVFLPRIIKHGEDLRSLESDRRHNHTVEPRKIGPDGNPVASLRRTSDAVDDSEGVPPEWTPPNVSVPLLNLVDKIFQLNRRGWLRRQVFWISKQILQLIMEDAIDDWLLMQIQWLRRDDIIAQGIHWVQDVLWPNGTFFLKLDDPQDDVGDSCISQKPRQTENQLTGNRISRPGSFESQLEAARRASDVKKMILGGAPSALVSLIGPKQYKRCARDIYHFLQSSICIKQLAYAILELILVTVFPELHDLIVDVHKKMEAQPT